MSYTEMVEHEAPEGWVTLVAMKSNAYGRWKAVLIDHHGGQLVAWGYSQGDALFNIRRRIGVNAYARA